MDFYLLDIPYWVISEFSRDYILVNNEWKFTNIFRKKWRKKKSFLSPDQKINQSNYLFILILLLWWEWMNIC